MTTAQIIALIDARLAELLEANRRQTQPGTGYPENPVAMAEAMASASAWRELAALKAKIESVGGTL